MNPTADAQALWDTEDADSFRRSLRDATATASEKRLLTKPKDTP